MPAYAYEAVDTQGRASRGTLEAESPRAARSQLRGRGLVPLSVQPVSEGAQSALRKSLQIELWKTRAFNTTQLTVLTRQMAGRVRAGLPLERALAVLSEEA